MPEEDPRLCAALQFLGTNWVCHPDYIPNPRHSNDPEIYALARQPYLLSVREAAEHDRLSNPNFQRAERYRSAIH